MQRLSLLSEPFIATLLIAALHSLRHLEQQLENASESLIMEKVRFRNLESHDFDEGCDQPFNVFDIQTEGTILRHQLRIDSLIFGFRPLVQKVVVSFVFNEVSNLSRSLLLAIDHEKKCVNLKCEIFKIKFENHNFL